MPPVLLCISCASTLCTAQHNTAQHSSARSARCARAVQELVLETWKASVVGTGHERVMSAAVPARVAIVGKGPAGRGGAGEGCLPPLGAEGGSSARPRRTHGRRTRARAQTHRWPSRTRGARSSSSRPSGSRGTTSPSEPAAAGVLGRRPARGWRGLSASDAVLQERLGLALRLARDGWPSEPPAPWQGSSYHRGSVGRGVPWLNCLNSSPSSHARRARRARTRPAAHDSRGCAS